LKSASSFAGARAGHARMEGEDGGKGRVFAWIFVIAQAKNLASAVCCIFSTWLVWGHEDEHAIRNPLCSIRPYGLDGARLEDIDCRVGRSPRRHRCDCGILYGKVNQRRWHAPSDRSRAQVVRGHPAGGRRRQRLRNWLVALDARRSRLSQPQLGFLRNPGGKS